MVVSLMTSTMLLRSALRLLVAVPLVMVAAFLIYGFGAGYFWPIGLPTPLNVVATVGLAYLALRSAWRFVASSEAQ